jgi:hypothetical protein
LTTPEGGSNKLPGVVSVTEDRPSQAVVRLVPRLRGGECSSALRAHHPRREAVLAMRRNPCRASLLEAHNRPLLQVASAPLAITVLTIHEAAACSTPGNSCPLMRLVAVSM